MGHENDFRCVCGASGLGCIENQKWSFMSYTNQLAIADRQTPIFPIIPLLASGRGYLETFTIDS